MQTRHSETDFDTSVQVITFEHAVSAAARGVLFLGACVVCAWLGWDFIRWIAEGMPYREAARLMGGGLYVYITGFPAFFAVLAGMQAMNLLLFVTLVYAIDRRLERKDAELIRRGYPQDFGR